MSKFILLVPLGCALLAQSHQSPAGTSVEKIVIDNERAVWEAAKDKDVQRFNRLVAEDARMIFESGIFTRNDYVSGIADRTITDFALTDFITLRPNEQTVIVIYTASRSGTYKGKAFPPSSVRESSVWVNRHGKWVAVLNQETAIGH